MKCSHQLTSNVIKESKLGCPCLLMKYNMNYITERLKKALALVDIRVLDHVIVGDETTCLSEQGLV